jgi:hypothetical protein
MGNENFPGLTGNFEVRAGRIRYFEVNHVFWANNFSTIWVSN